VDAQQWLEQVQRELRRQKLPPLYVERFLSELSDHIFDSVEDPMSTDARDLHKLAHRLGAPREIAATAAHEFRKAHFCRRHPVLMFVALPLVSLPLIWVTIVFVIVGIGKAIYAASGAASGAVSSGPPESIMSSLPFVMLALIAVPVAVCAIAFCRLAARASVSWKWMLAACCILALVGSMAFADIGVPTGGPMRGKNGQLMLGLGVTKHPRPSQLFQFAVPLAIGGWALYRQISTRQQTFAN
jgi:uncharacterized membrane protein YhaH (DUF805 family)